MPKKKNTKEGTIKVSQKKQFENIMIKKS